MSAPYFDEARRVARQLAQAGFTSQAIQINEAISYGIGGSTEHQRDVSRTISQVMAELPYAANDIKRDLKRLSA